VDAQRWEQCSRLFENVIDLPEAERDGYIDARCAGDPELAATLRRMLAADVAAESRCFLEPALAPPAAALWDESAVGTREYAPGSRRFGPYRLLRLIGEGGMGEVHLAERADGTFEQRVALKLLPHPTPGLMQRFRQERQILARLEHPNIARLLDGGVGEHGIPYFAMEYVDGVPIASYVRDHGFTVAQTLRLFLQVCDGVQYAHRNLVVHRDLKPSNILVTGDAVPKLLDFGIAKVLEDTGQPEATRTQARMFTLDYAAPEQIRGEAITTATDVYALGVVLYELLAGRRPYSLGARSTTLEQAILETSPQAPSAVLASGDATTTQRRRELRGDLDRIVLSALAKEQERRYPSADALAADIRNYLDGRPVAARGDAPMYRLRKFIRRNRIGVAAAAVVVAALVAAMSVSLWQAGIARQQAQRAETKSRTAEAVKDYLLSVFSSANPYNTEGKLVSARDLLEGGFARVDEKLSGQPEVAAEIYAAFVETFFALDQADLGERAAEKANTAYRRFLPADAIEILRIESRVAEIRLFRAQTDGLADQLTDMLARIGDRGGDFAELRADVLTLLGLTYYELGSYDRAVEFGERAVAELQKLHGRVHYSVSVVLYDIALARLKQGRIADAAALIDEFVAIDRSLVGPQHPGLTTDVTTISMLLHDVGRLRETRDLMNAAIAARQRQFAETHRSIVKARARLAAVLVDLGNAKQAEELVAGVIASAATASMPTLDRSEIRFDRARALIELNRLDEARAEFQSALDLVRAAAPADSPLSLTIAAALADVERRQGRPQQALALLEPIVRQQRMRDDRDLPESLLAQARANLAAGKPDATDKTLAEAAAALDHQGRPTHPLAREIELEQAALAFSGGDAKFASEHLLRAASIGCVNFGCDDARVTGWIRAAAAAGENSTAGSPDTSAAFTARARQSPLALGKPYETQYAAALDIIAKANAAVNTPSAATP